MPAQLFSLAIGIYIWSDLSYSVILCAFKHGRLGEHNGAVVECLTRDRGAVGSSLTGITMLCP